MLLHSLTSHTLDNTIIFIYLLINILIIVITVFFFEKKTLNSMIVVYYISQHTIIIPKLLFQIRLRITPENALSLTKTKTNKID